MEFSETRLTLLARIKRMMPSRKQTGIATHNASGISMLGCQMRSMRVKMRYKTAKEHSLNPLDDLYRVDRVEGGFPACTCQECGSTILGMSTRLVYTPDLARSVALS